jgi:hypothetical protein
MTICAIAQANSKYPQSACEPTQVEHAQPLAAPRPGTLATADYSPSEQEKRFFSKLSPDETVTGSMLSGDYSIIGKKGVYVGWFGIVRRIEESQTANQTKLLIENKYFDGLTDTHILAISFNGGGDFVATLCGTRLGIKHLSMVKVYGFVRDEDNSVPEIRAEYVRHWDWGRFTFLGSYGKQKGNTEWKKFNRIKEDKIYNPFPNQRYYEDRLGLRKE